jgi:hypothetical protein
MKGHDRLGRHSYVAMGRFVSSCQVRNLFPIS